MIIFEPIPMSPKQVAILEYAAMMQKQLLAFPNGLNAVVSKRKYVAWNAIPMPLGSMRFPVQEELN